MRVTSIRRHPDFGVVVIDQDPRGIGKQRHESCIWLWEAGGIHHGAGEMGRKPVIR